MKTCLVLIALVCHVEAREGNNGIGNNKKPLSPSFQQVEGSHQRPNKSVQIPTKTPPNRPLPSGRRTPSASGDYTRQPVKPTVTNDDWRAAYEKQCKVSVQKSKNVEGFFVDVMQGGFRNIAKKFKSKAGLKSHLKQQISSAIDALPDEDGEMMSDIEKQKLSEVVKDMLGKVFPQIKTANEAILGKVNNILHSMPMSSTDLEKEEEETECHAMKKLMTALSRGLSKICPSLHGDAPNQIRDGSPIKQGKGFIVQNKENEKKRTENGPTSHSRGQAGQGALAFGFEHSGEPSSFCVNSFLMAIVVLSQALFAYFLY